MKFPKTAFLIALLGLITASANSEVPEDEVIQSERTYKTVGDRELEIYVFLPPSELTDSSRAAILFIHGGGWNRGEPAELFGACRRYAAKGLVTFSVEYRLHRENPATNSPIESVLDARSAMRWVRAHAAEFEFDPNKIVVGGQSVGGQLTLACALFDTLNEATDDLTISTMPNAMLLYSGATNAVETWTDNMLGDRRASIWAISPEHNLKPGLPPTIAFHGRADHMVPYWKIRQFQRAMDKLENPFELVTLPGRDHYLAPDNKKYATLFDEGIMETTDDFLRRHGFLPEED